LSRFMVQFRNGKDTTMEYAKKQVRGWNILIPILKEEEGIKVVIIQYGYPILGLTRDSITAHGRGRREDESRRKNTV